MSGHNIVDRETRQPRPWNGQAGVALLELGVCLIALLVLISVFVVSEPIKAALLLRFLAACCFGLGLLVAYHSKFAGDGAQFLGSLAATIGLFVLCGCLLGLSGLR